MSEMVSISWRLAHAVVNKAAGVEAAADATEAARDDADVSTELAEQRYTSQMHTTRNNIAPHLHCVPEKKTGQSTFGHSFGKCTPIFETLLLLDCQGNCRRMRGRDLLHYLVKFEN